jgi:hypoxanthine phosphoribosyltransferase
MDVSWSELSWLVTLLEFNARVKGPTAVVAIIPGGLVPGVMLADRLQLPLHVFDAAMSEIEGKVLLVDSLQSTGRKLLVTKQNIEALFCPDVITAVLVVQGDEVYHPDVKGMRALKGEKVWFPWEVKRG